MTDSPYPNGTSKICFTPLALCICLRASDKSTFASSCTLCRWIYRWR